MTRHRHDLLHVGACLLLGIGVTKLVHLAMTSRLTLLAMGYYLASPLRSLGRRFAGEARGA